MALSLPSQFSALLAEKDSQGKVGLRLTARLSDELPPGELLVRVAYSSLNYKDALAAQGHPGVVKTLPHVPGIDAVGTILESSDPAYAVGDAVLVTGNGLGAEQWGGWSELIRVPAAWAVPLPAGLSPLESMMLGTAGFTAAQSVLAIQLGQVQPSDGEIVVTGATGGVGCLAVKLLAQLGYSVTAVTGKPALAERLKSWGATRVIGRDEVVSTSTKPLLPGRWAGAVDTVGGATLTTILRETNNYGVVTACGLVGGIELPLTVHPFILRGITLAGIGSALLPMNRRLGIWERLAGPWKIAGLEALTTVIGLTEVPLAVEKILRGEIVGRTVVKVET